MGVLDNIDKAALKNLMENGYSASLANQIAQQELYKDKSRTSQYTTGTVGAIGNILGFLPKQSGAAVQKYIYKLFDVNSKSIGNQVATGSHVMKFPLLVSDSIDQSIVSKFCAMLQLERAEYIRIYFYNNEIINISDDSIAKEFNSRFYEDICYYVEAFEEMNISDVEELEEAFDVLVECCDELKEEYSSLIESYSNHYVRTTPTSSKDLNDYYLRQSAHNFKVYDAKKKYQLSRETLKDHETQRKWADRQRIKNEIFNAREAQKKRVHDFSLQKDAQTFTAKQNDLNRKHQSDENELQRQHQSGENALNREHTSKEKDLDRKHQAKQNFFSRLHQSRENSKNRKQQASMQKDAQKHQSKEAEKQRAHQEKMQKDAQAFQKSMKDAEMAAQAKRDKAQSMDRQFTLNDPSNSGAMWGAGGLKLSSKDLMPINPTNINLVVNKAYTGEESRSIIAIRYIPHKIPFNEMVVAFKYGINNSRLMQRFIKLLSGDISFGNFITKSDARALEWEFTKISTDKKAWHLGLKDSTQAVSIIITKQEFDHICKEIVDLSNPVNFKKFQKDIGMVDLIILDKDAKEFIRINALDNYQMLHYDIRDALNANNKDLVINARIDQSKLRDEEY